MTQNPIWNVRSLALSWVGMPSIFEAMIKTQLAELPYCPCSCACTCGLPIFQAPSVRAIRKGMPLFLFNYSTRCLWGVFEAASDGGLNLDPYAWENTEISRLEKSPVSRYPAQVRVNYKFMRPPLDESTFRPILEHIEGHKFRLELSAFQVKQLLKLFLVPEEAFFGDKSLKLIQSPGIINSLPESPRSIVKLDSDSHSECSSKGTYPGEDDWFEEDQEGKGTIYIPSSEHHVCNFSSMSSDGLPNDKHIYSTSGTPLSHVRSNALTQNQQSTINDGTYRSHFQYQPDTFELRERNGMPLKFCDVDPALNSTPVALKQACAQQLQSDDDPQESPCIAFNQPAPIFSYRNMIYIPVQMPLRKIAISQGKGDDEKNLAGGQPANKQTYRSENLKNIDPELSKFCNHPPNQPFLCHDQILFPFPVLALQPKLIYDPTQVTVIGGHVPHNLMEQDFTVSPSPPHPSETLAEREGAWNHSRLHGGAWHRVSYNPVPFVLSAVPMVPQSLRFPAAGFSEKLHSNILYFARLTRPSIEKQLFVVTAVDCVRNCVRALWSGADVEVYGSFATGLCLQHSDVDLAILNVPLPLLANSSESQASASLLKELGLSLKAAKHCDSINVIANASVPVLKCLFRPTMELSSSLSSLDGISIDITIGDTQRSTQSDQQHVRKSTNMNRLKSIRHTGGPARDYVIRKIQELPALAPLVFVLKSFLHHKGLSNVYLGGLGSFSLTLLLVYFLERTHLSGELITASRVRYSDKLSVSVSGFPRSLCKEGGACRSGFAAIDKILSLWETGGASPLGDLLLNFLRMFGFEHDLAREKIVLNQLDGSPGGIFKRNNQHIALWIDDPLRPGVNIAGGSFRMFQVQAAFRELFLALTHGQALFTPLQCEDKDCHDLAAFGQLTLQYATGGST
ncbi:hypothetical protein KP509_01G129400 [Ceratopteris richardii]|uniref:DCD domain-containing protein n=1 Tax=Ceratopteris richardii TaxID=49495 RepID=A0A8T2VHF5_CERRI|nr:hypothetical protein KP509_01G129400 [Ceratopteris richardii]